MDDPQQAKPKAGDQALPARFRDFYPVYLKAHQHPLNRAIHYAGATTVVSGLILAIVREQILIFVTAVAITYAVLWTSHAFVERNFPLSLKGGVRPFLMSIFGEFYMTWRFITGRIRSDLERYDSGKQD